MPTLDSTTVDLVLVIAVVGLVEVVVPVVAFEPNVDDFVMGGAVVFVVVVVVFGPAVSLTVAVAGLNLLAIVTAAVAFLKSY